MDSLVRLRQLNNPEVSGYTVAIIRQYLTTGTGVPQTGSLTGIFYPLKQNPSGYINSGLVVLKTDTGNFVDTTALAIADSMILSQVSSTYYPLSNPSGFISQVLSDGTYLKFNSNNNTGAVLIFEPSGAFYPFEFRSGQAFKIRGVSSSIINLYGTGFINPYISGFSIRSNDIKIGSSPATSFDDVSSMAILKTLGSSNTQLLLFNAAEAANKFLFLNDTSFYLKGKDNAIIDLYDEVNGYTRPYISGFDVYANYLTVSGINIGTGISANAVTQAQLLATSGVLDNDIDALQTRLVNTGKLIGNPVELPKTLYLTNYYQNYQQKGLLAYNTLNSLMTGISGFGQNLRYFINVGTGNFGTTSLSGLGTMFGLGSLTFNDEFNSSPTLSFNLRNCSGNISFYGDFALSLDVSGCNMSLYGDEDNKPISNPLNFSRSTGTIYGFYTDLLAVNHRSNLTVSHSEIFELSAGATKTGLVSLTIDQSDITLIDNDEAIDTTRVTFTDSIIAGREKISRPAGAPFISFLDTSLSDNGYGYTHSIPKSYGGFAYSNNDLYLQRNKTGTVTSDLILTKTTGDSLYYSSSNPSSYVNVAYLTSFYAPLATAVVKVSQSSNDSLYLFDLPSFSNPFVYLSAQSFYLQNTGGKSIIDIYGKSSLNGLTPYISGFEIYNASLITATTISGNAISGNNIYLSGVKLQTGNFATTGFVDAGYYPRNNPSGYVTSVGSAGISNIIVTGFAVTGSVTFTGINGIQLSTGNSSTVRFDGSNFTLNSQTGNFVTISQTGNFVDAGQTGNFITLSQTGAFYPRSSNPSGYLTNSTIGVYVIAGNGITSNTNVDFTDNPSTKTVLSLAQGNRFYLQGTGTGVNPLIDIYSGIISGFNVNISGQNPVTGSVVRPSQTGSFITTSQTGQFYAANNPSGYITAGQVGGITTINTTGFLVSGAVTFTGINGIQLSTGNSTTIRFDGSSFALSSQTGSFITSNQTGGFVGTNQTGNFITSSQTGNFVGTNQTGSFITTGQTGAFVWTGSTGSFVLTSQTGQFYPTSNPSGYITSAQIGVSSLNVTGFVLTGTITFTGINGIVLTTGNSSNIRFDGSNFALASQTGNFITTSQTGGFVGTNQTGNFITSSQTGNFVGINQTGSFITTGQTGAFVWTGSTGNFVLTSQTGSFVTSASNLNSSGSGLFVSKVGTDLQFKSLVTGTGILISGSGNALIISILPNYITTSQTGGFVGTNQTGNFVTINQTGQFYPSNNPSGFITSAQGGVSSINVTGFTATGALTFTGINGIILNTGNSTTIRFDGSNFALASQTGNFITTGQTGIYATVSYVNSSFLSAGAATTNNPNINLFDAATSFSVMNLTAGSHFYLQGTGTGVGANTLIDIYSGIISGFNVYVSGQSVITGSVVRPSQTGSFITTGQTGQFYPNSNPSGYITAAQAGGITTLNVTGFLVSGAVTFTGINGISLSTGNSTTIRFDGSSLVQTSQTGIFVGTNQTGIFVGTNQTGQFYASNNPSGYITQSQAGVLTVNITGLTTSGNLTFTGIGGISLSTGSSSTIIRFDGSSFVQTSQTGIFVGTNQTGIFVGTNQTGSFITTGQTGIFVGTNQTGQFYPTSNPSGYITSAQAGGVSNINITGFTLSGTVIFTGINGIQLSTGNSTTVRFDGSNFALASQTGIFITTSQTGQFVGTGQTGNFVTGATNIGAGNGVFANKTSGSLQFKSFTMGNGILLSVDSTTIDISVDTNVVLTSQTGNFVTSASNQNSSGSGLFIQKSGAELQFKSLVTGTGILISGSGNALIISILPNYITSSQTGGFVGTNQTGIFVGTNQTGNFITTGQTGQFYPSSNPSGYITSAQGAGVSSINITGFTTTGALTFTGINGIILSTGNSTNIRFDGSNFALVSQTGSFITTGQTGVFASTGFVNANYYPLLSNPSGYILSSQTGVYASVAYVNSSFFYSGPITTSNLNINIYDAPTSRSVMNLTAGSHFYLQGTGTGANVNPLIDIYSGIISGFNISVSGQSVVTGSVIRPGDTGTFATDGANTLGNTAGGVYSGKIGSLIQFKNLKATVGSGLLISSTNATLDLSVDTSYVITTGQTGAFYPRLTNPSGFITSVTSAGTAGSIVSGTVSNVVTIKTLKATVGSGIVVDQSTNPQTLFLSVDTSYVITTGQTGRLIGSASNIGVGSGLYSGSISGDLKFKNLIGGSGIQISGTNFTDLTIIVTGIAGSTGTSNYTLNPYEVRFYV